MKSIICPNCGERKVAQVEVPSKVIINCKSCGKSLLIKMDKPTRWSVVIDEMAKDNCFNK